MYLNLVYFYIFFNCNAMLELFSCIFLSFAVCICKCICILKDCKVYLFLQEYEENVSRNLRVANYILFYADADSQMKVALTNIFEPNIFTLF